MYKSLKTVGLGAVFLAPMAFGAGFQLNEFSVAAQGRANAGEPAMADNAAAIARNPAAMAAFDKPAASVTYHYIDPEIDVTATITPTSPYPATSINADAEDIAPSASIPGLYYVNPINDKWFVGVALNSHFGLSTDYGSNYAGTEFAQETSVKTYYLTPSVSFKPVETVALGLGLNYVYGEGIIKNSASPSDAAATGGGIPNNTPLLNLEGDGDAWGYQLGLTWDVVENHRLGLRFQSAVDLDFDGDITMAKIPSARSGVLTLNLPEIYELGYVATLNDRFRIMAGIQNNGWSRFKSLTADIDNVGEVKLKDEDWEDSWRYSIGAEFVSDDMVTLRVGYGIDESPVKSEKRTLTIPDADRNWFTVGATFDLKKLGSIDTALMYIDGDNVDVNETTVLNGAPLIKTDINGELSSVSVIIYSIGYNYAF